MTQTDHGPPLWVAFEILSWLNLNGILSVSTGALNKGETD